VRYYKHMTDMLSSADGQRILRERGYAGYGRLHAIMEAVAGNTKPGKPFEMTRRTAWWAGHLETTANGLRSLLRSAERSGDDAGLVEWSETGAYLTIAIPKLAKYRDEYRRKSGHTSGEHPDEHPERLPVSEVRGQRDKERPPTEVQRKAASAAHAHVCDDLCKLAEAARELGHPWRCDSRTTRKALTKIRLLATDYAGGAEAEWLAVAVSVLRAAHADMSADARRRYFNSTHFARPANFARYVERQDHALTKQQTPKAPTLRQMREFLADREQGRVGVLR